jgi:hypothetical protein
MKNNTFETLADLRKAIKPLGFKVKTKSLSWGQHATYARISDGVELNGNVFTPETFAEWKPLFDFFKENTEQIKNLREATGIIGLRYT